MEAGAVAMSSWKIGKIPGQRRRRQIRGWAHRLFAAAGEPKELWIVPGADHGEAHAFAGEEYERRVLEFYSKYLHVK